jgi:mRNA interferase YafQ
MEKIHAIIRSLRNRERLASKHKDHALAGEWEGYRNCHIEADWILIYMVSFDTLRLARTGTHSDLKL